MPITMTDEAKRQYARLGLAQHAMQAGVGHYTKAALPEADDDLIRQLKFLRVGINTALCEVGAMAHALMEKGLIDPAEYYRNLAELVERDVAGYENQLKADFGIDIKLKGWDAR